MQRISTLIPARSGSKRVRDKNIRQLGEHPLIGWSIRTAIECGLPTFVSTNSPEIEKVATECDPRVAILRRPDSLCQDDSTDRDVIDHAVFALGIPPGSIIAYLRPTTPFRDPSTIMSALSYFIAHPDIHCLRCVEELTESSFKTFTMEDGYLIPTLGRLMDANLPNHLYPPTYRNNGYLDLYRIPYDDERVMGFKTDKVIEIDTEIDLQYAEFSLKERKAKND